MSASTNVNFRTVVHKSSDGLLITFPDICKTPTPSGPIPIPYPNLAKSSDTASGSKSVKVDGNPVMLQNSNFSISTGDEPGSLGGIISGVTKGKAEFINYSFDVKFENKNVCRLLDLMISNKKNTMFAPELQPPLVILPSMCQDPEMMYTLVVVFSFKHPNVTSGNQDLPHFESPHELNGPKTLSSPSGRDNYSSVMYHDVPEGQYQLKFSALNRTKRSYRKD